MCYFCHNLKNSPSAPGHRSINCLDRANTYSKIPIDERKYNNGKPIVSARLIIIRTATLHTGN